MNHESNFHCSPNAGSPLKLRNTCTVHMKQNYGSEFLFYFPLTVHLSITLVNDQLDAQFLYFIIRLLQSSTCFEQRRAHHQEVKFYCSSLSTCIPDGQLQFIQTKEILCKNVGDDGTTRGAFRNETGHTQAQEERRWRKSEQGTKMAGG